MTNSALTHLTTQLVDRSGNGIKLAGFVTRGCTLTEGIIQLVKQHGGTCTVVFNANYDLNEVKIIEVGGVKLEDWIQVYDAKGGMLARVIEFRNGDNIVRQGIWENTDSIRLTGDSNTFIFKDDFGKTQELPNLGVLFQEKGTFDIFSNILRVKDPEFIGSEFGLNKVIIGGGGDHSSDVTKEQLAPLDSSKFRSGEGESGIFAAGQIVVSEQVSVVLGENGPENIYTKDCKHDLMTQNGARNFIKDTYESLGIQPPADIDKQARRIVEKASELVSMSNFDGQPLTLNIVLTLGSTMNDGFELSVNHSNPAQTQITEADRQFSSYLHYGGKTVTKENEEPVSFVFPAQAAVFHEELAQTESRNFDVPAKLEFRELKVQELILPAQPIARIDYPQTQIYSGQKEFVLTGSGIEQTKSTVETAVQPKETASTQANNSGSLQETDQPPKKRLRLIFSDLKIPEKTDAKKEEAKKLPAVTKGKGQKTAPSSLTDKEGRPVLRLVGQKPAESKKPTEPKKEHSKKQVVQKAGVKTEPGKEALKAGAKKEEPKKAEKPVVDKKAVAEEDKKTAQVLDFAGFKPAVDKKTGQKEVLKKEVQESAGRTKNKIVSLRERLAELKAKPDDPKRRMAFEGYWEEKNRAKENALKEKPKLPPELAKALEKSRVEPAKVIELRIVKSEQKTAKIPRKVSPRREVREENFFSSPFADASFLVREAKVKRIRPISEPKERKKLLIEEKPKKKAQKRS